MRQPLERRSLHLIVQGKKINVYGWNARGTKELLIGAYEFDDVALYTDVSQDMSKVEAFLFTSIRKRMNAAASKIIFRERLTDNKEVLEIQEYYKQEIGSLEWIFNHNCDCYRDLYLKNNEDKQMKIQNIRAVDLIDGIVAEHISNIDEYDTVQDFLESIKQALCDGEYLATLDTDETTVEQAYSLLDNGEYELKNA